MPSGLHFPRGPGHLLPSRASLESWRISHWSEQPADEPRREFSDRDALDSWLRQFESPLLREVAESLVRDFSQSPCDDDQIVSQLAGRILQGSLTVHGPHLDDYIEEHPTRPARPAVPKPNPARPPRRPEDKVKPRIVAVEFLDGHQDKRVSSARQYVNLPAKTKWVDGSHVLNKDRLGHKPRIRVWFDRPGSHGFKVRLIPGAANRPYSAAEKGRNPRFRFQETEKSYATGGDGTTILPIDDFFITAAGGHAYTVEATDEHGNTARSGVIESRRLVHYLPIKMRNLTAAASSLAVFEGEYARHAIDMVALPTVEMPHRHNIGPDDEAALKRAAQAAYRGSQAPAREPFVLAVVFTDHLAVKNPGQALTYTGLTVGPGQPDQVLDIIGPGLTNPALAPRSLWINLVPGEDWFVSATYTPTGGAVVALPKAKCTPVPDNAATPDNCTSVRVDVSGLPAGTGSITLTVNWVDRMRGGLAFGAGNAILIGTRAWWRTKSQASQNETLVHEAGHQVGMVSRGVGLQPDEVATRYDNAKGHVGNHCHHGIPAGQARYDSSADRALSDCVMYGAGNGHSAFCPSCSPAVHKVDLSAGWARF
ncbi:MAG TPA: hypothetical protein PK359_02760 [Burkholderiaceae bacterium]|nr:hypothetical protein [Burkholderiaceae bacterium]